MKSTLYLTKFLEVPEIRGKVALLYLENGKSYEKILDEETTLTFYYKMQCPDLLYTQRLKLERAHRKCVKKPKYEIFGVNDPLSENFAIFFQKNS